jgi:hypothetical protein
MFWPRTGVKHARNIEIVSNLISMFSMFRACFCLEHWSMPAVLCHNILFLLLNG